LSGEAPSSGPEDAWAEGLGAPLWEPPAHLLERGSKKAQGRTGVGVFLSIAAVVCMVAAAMVAGPGGGYDTATALMVVAVIIGIVASWVLYAARKLRRIRFGIYPTGVLMPASFESVPGLSTLGGPVAIARGDIDRVEDLRAGGDRAIVVWSKAGRSGILSAKPEGLELTDEESVELLELFVRALAKWGIEAGGEGEGA
jgi:hypothetical protein